MKKHKSPTPSWVGAFFDHKFNSLIAGPLLSLAWLLSRLTPASSWSKILFILVTLISGLPILRSAISQLRWKVVGIPALVSIAAIGASLIGEYWEAAVVTFLYSFGEYLQNLTLEKTRGALKSLMDSAPKTARVLRGDEEVEIPAGQVQKEEHVIVRPGEKIPVDGVVVRGQAAVNQAAITGESIPVERSSGDEVTAGGILELGYLQIKALRVGEDTTYSRIIHLVEEAQEAKAPAQQFLETFARYYTPGIIIMAGIALLVTRNLTLSLTLLVIACPGALVIAAPVSFVAGIGNAAKRGVLFKGGVHLEAASRINAIALDKTGTLTEGQPEVVAIYTGRDETEFLRKVAGAELYSEHHLGGAIIRAYKEEPPQPEEFETIPGQGVIAQVERETLYVGNRKLMQEHQVELGDYEELAQTQESMGRTVIWVGKEGKVEGLIAIADVLREGSVKLIHGLKKLGIKKIVLLTGDNSRTAEALAAELGIEEVSAELMPEDKLTEIRRLQEQGYQVAMVGDGVNDAPALAGADLGIAMGLAGTDAAVETADLTLVSDQPEEIPYALALSRATMANLKQNVIFALVVVFALLLGVLVGKVFLGLGMFIHQLSVLAVIVNAMRLLGYKGGFGRSLQNF